MWKEIITSEAPYDFEMVLERLSHDPLNCVDPSTQSIKVPIYIEGMSYVVTVIAKGSIQSPSFEISGTDVKAKDILIQRIKTIFQYDQSLTDVMSHFKKTSLEKVFVMNQGTPIVLDFHPAWCLYKCIIHQQLNLSFAHTLTERFVKKYGYELEGVWFYPTAETISQITVEDLRDLQFSTRKAEYIIEIATKLVDGTLVIEQLEKLSDDDVMNQLIKIRGIGPWTVQNFLMFGLGRLNLFPMADIGIQNALKHVFHLDRKPTKEEMVQWSSEWKPYLSYASLYLWRSIEKRKELS